MENNFIRMAASAGHAVDYTIAPFFKHIIDCQLKQNVTNIHLFNYCEQKFIQHGPITIAIDCKGLSLLIFEEKWPNYASEPKSALKSDSFWVRRVFNVCVRVICAPNALILLVYILDKFKMSFIWKNDFFCQNRHLL